MSWSNTITVPKTPIGGGLYVVGGEFVDATTTGESIVTGLSKALFCGANANVTAKAIGIKESATAGTLTIYGEASTDDGYWWAIGR
jgi:hypothetical protein